MDHNAFEHFLGIAENKLDEAIGEIDYVSNASNLFEVEKLLQVAMANIISAKNVYDSIEKGGE